MVPLKSTGSTQASLAPLADLALQSTVAVATVITGELRRGRALLESAERIPLIVEQAYGAGKVLQLAFDPLAEPVAGNDALGALAFDQALARSVNSWGTNRAIAPQDQLWSSTFVRPPWPRWSLGEAGLPIAYLALVIPVAFAVSRTRSRRRLMWATIPCATLLFAGAPVVIGEPGRGSVERTVVVDTFGPGGSVLTNTYRGIVARRPSGTIDLGRAAATSYLTAAGLRPFSQEELQSPGEVPRGEGGGSIGRRGDAVELHQRVRPWAARSVQTLSIRKEVGGLEAHLRLVGTVTPPALGTVISGPTPDHRIQGTVTNHGSRPLRVLRAQLPEGAQVRVADTLAPGATVTIDAPVLWATTHPTGTSPKASPDELLLFSVASRAFTGPGQLAVVGVSTTNDESEHGTSRVVVQTAPLEASQQLVASLGASNHVSSFTRDSGSFIDVHDLEALPGVVPLAIAYHHNPKISRIDIYNWDTHTWRPLPTTETAQAPKTSGQTHLIPLADGELHQGVTRVRTERARTVPISYKLVPNQG